MTLPATTDVSAGLRFRTKPYAHQRAALAAGYGREAFAYLMEMRTGKTKVIIDEAQNLCAEGKLDTVVVIAPRGVHQDWRAQWHQHGFSRIPVAGLRQPVGAEPPPVLVHVWGGGTTKGEQRTIKSLCETPCALRVLTINWDALNTSKGRAAIDAVLASSGRGSMVVADEAHRAKTPTAQRTKALLRLRQAATYRRILTGTPVANNPLDLWAPFQFLDPAIIGIGNFFAFRARYAILRERQIPNRPAFKEIVGWQRLDELQQKVGAASYSITAAECLDLPERVYREHRVALADAQRHMYISLRDRLLVELESGEHMSAPLALTQLLRLQQLLGGTVTPDGGAPYQLPAIPRDAALLEVLADVPSPGKVIVWTRFTPERRRVAAMLRQQYGEDAAAGVAEVVPLRAQVAEDSIVRFQTDDACRFLVANPEGTAGEGRDFSMANMQVFYSSSFRLTARLQAEARCDAPGRKQSVLVVDLVTDPPDETGPAVDEIVVKALRRKRDIAQRFTGEALRAVLRGEHVNDGD